jgi:hypothetical protein
MVLVLTLLGTAFAEQPAINGMPGSLTWQKRNWVFPAEVHNWTLPRARDNVAYGHVVTSYLD